MDIKTAKEIVAHPENHCDNPMLHQRFDNAKGFIEGHEAGRREILESQEIEALYECASIISEGKGGIILPSLAHNICSDFDRLKDKLKQEGGK